MHTTIGYRRRNLRRTLSRICRRCRDHRGNPSEPSLGFEESWPTLTKVRLALFQLKFPSVPRQAQPRNCHLANHARVWGCLTEATLAAVSAGRSCAWRRLQSEDASSGISLIKVWQFGSRLVRGRPSKKRECWKEQRVPPSLFQLTFPLAPRQLSLLQHIKKTHRGDVETPPDRALKTSPLYPSISTPRYALGIRLPPLSFNTQAPRMLLLYWVKVAKLQSLERSACAAGRRHLGHCCSAEQSGFATPAPHTPTCDTRHGTAGPVGCPAPASLGTMLANISSSSNCPCWRAVPYHHCSGTKKLSAPICMIGTNGMKMPLSICTTSVRAFLWMCSELYRFGRGRSSCDQAMDPSPPAICSDLGRTVPQPLLSRLQPLAAYRDT